MYSLYNMKGVLSFWSSHNTLGHIKHGFNIILLVLVVSILSGCAADKADAKPSLKSHGKVNISLSNGTDGYNTSSTSTTTTTTTTTTKEPSAVELPPAGEEEREHHYGMTIFFILLVLAICILVVHLLLKTNFHYLPESVAVVIVGAFLGLFVKLLDKAGIANWQAEEHFPPTMFFLILLPPIIFESGYNLHKGNFFQNLGTIMLFAVFGTIISAVVVGGSIYLLGVAQVIYKFSLIESFAFGSMISAVDPVATLAIFSAIDVDPILYMLVFGESILNDAVAIVLTKTVVELDSPEMQNISGAAIFFTAVGNFCVMFFASAAIGTLFGLVSAMMLKFLDLRKTPSLEFGMIMMFSYAPYGLAEGLHLSGIMAILFCGIVMSHYTHINLSPVTQITVQQTWRTIAFICETCVFAYLGLAIFSMKHVVKPALVIWSTVLILIGRAANIFPLSFLANFFREHQITKRNQLIMWFSGLRGAIAFALSLTLEFEDEKRHVLMTTTLIIVLFTILFLGGSTMPMLKFCADPVPKKKKSKKKEVSLSKTKEMGEALDSEHLSEYTTEDEQDVKLSQPAHRGFLKIDTQYLIPFFTRKFTIQEARDGKKQMAKLANQWYQDVRTNASESEEDEIEFDINSSLIPQETIRLGTQANSSV